MEAKMESLQLEGNAEHQLSLEASHASDVIHDDPPIGPCIGSEHQAEIPNLATEDERCRLMASSLYRCKLHGYDYPSVIGLAIPIMWESHPPSEVNKKEEKLQAPHSLETESTASNRDKESQLTSICSNCNNTSECNSTYLNPHAVLPVDQIDSESNQVYDEKLAPCFTQECLNLIDRPMMQQRENKQFAPLPGSSGSLWNDLEEEYFLLGLYIFGKNLSLLSKFVGSKTVADVLSYYYGRFYNRDAYKRWSHCRKTRTSRCILGGRIFTGRRLQELISRLKSKIPKEAHGSLLEVFKCFSDGLTSLEECVFTLKSTIGTEAFVEVVGIGKGRHDLTGFVQDTSKTNQALSVHADMPTGKNCSSLASEDIVKLLTGDFRRSKAKSNDLFWEAVWPRLLARGWHSEQPRDVRTTKNCLVFLVPGIKKFSSRNLTKGTHYFDSVSDVLKKVAADPILLELEVDGIDNGATVHKNGQATEQDSPLDGDHELPKFTVIDTSLVQGEEPFKVRELRSLPADANISFGPSRHSDNMLSDSSSQEQDGDDSSSDDQEDRGRVTARVNDIEMVSVYNTGKESHVDLLKNMGTAPCLVFPVNGHSSDDQHSDISNGNGDKIDLTRFSGLGTKTGRRVYLSPVSKRRRFARCSNDQTSQHSFSFSNDDGLKKHKIKPISTSSKPTVVDVGGIFQTRTLSKCPTKEKPCEQITKVAKGLMSPIGTESVKLVEKKKRKASALDFAPVRFNIKAKKTRSSSVPAASDQNTHQEEIPEVRVVESAPEQVAAPVLVPVSQDSLAASSPSKEARVEEKPQQVSPPAGIVQGMRISSLLRNSPHPSNFPNCSRIFDDEKLEEAWRRISDRQLETGPNAIFSEYANMAIQHMVENVAVVGGLTQRITVLEKKNSELKKFEKFEGEIMAKEAMITRLQERCQAKDRSIEDLTTRHKEAIEAFEEKTQEQVQKLERTEKALEFEQDKEKELARNLEEKIIALNKILADMGSQVFLPFSRDPMEKVNCLSRQVECLQNLLTTTRRNHAHTMKDAVANGVSFALAKLKASNPSINLQAIEADFNCSEGEAAKIFEGVMSFGNKVADEMEVGSPSHSDQSGVPKL